MGVMKIAWKMEVDEAMEQEEGDGVFLGEIHVPLEPRLRADGISST